MTSEFEIFGWENEESKVLILFICVLLMIMTSVRLLYENTFMKTHFPESTLLVSIGLVIGLFLTAIPHDNIQDLKKYFTFSPAIFLELFIPIIIFDATYFLNKSAFFNNFLEILTYAIIGTLISTVVISLLLIATQSNFVTNINNYEIMTFAALISAVDPVAVIAIMESMHVNEDLFNLCFGESTLNDGVAIVLFKLFGQIETLFEEGKSIGTIFGLGVAKFLVSVIGAILLGTAVSLVFCLVTRISSRILNTQPLLLLVCAMLCYTLADMLLFSGVIAVMTCALVLVRYAEYNLQESSINTFTSTTHMFAQTFETLLFMDMGIQLAFIAQAGEKIDYYFAFIQIPFTIIARVIGTTAQTFFLNFKRQKLGKKLTWRDQIILVMSGLRGGIAFALAKSWDLLLYKSDQIVLATGVVIVFTIFVFGLLMRPVIKALKIKLVLHHMTNEEFAATNLARPATNCAHFMQSMLGYNACCGSFLATIDKIFQKIFLNQKIDMNRELQHNVMQIKQMYMQRLEMEMTIKKYKELKKLFKKQLKQQQENATEAGHEELVNMQHQLNNIRQSITFSKNKVSREESPHMGDEPRVNGRKSGRISINKTIDFNGNAQQEDTINLHQPRISKEK